MEFYFLQPSTKYDWEDFQKKVFKRDSGEELRRKVIIKNIHATSEVEYIELKHVCLHLNGLLQADLVKGDCYRKLQEYFHHLKNYLYDYFIYIRIKDRFQNSKNRSHPSNFRKKQQGCGDFAERA